MKYSIDISKSTFDLILPLLIILLIIILVLYFYYFYTQHRDGGVNHRGGELIGIDLTSVDDIKTMRSEMIDLTVQCVKYIRSNYNETLADIGKVLWRRRGNSDQWTMAIAIEDIDNYKAGDIVWCGDPGLLCSGNIPFCNLAANHLAAIKKNPTGRISLNDLIDKKTPLSITLENDVNGTTFIVSLGNIKTKKGIWIKRSEGLAYPMHDRRIMFFVFGIYDYTGILYDFDQDFQTHIARAFGIKN